MDMVMLPVDVNRARREVLATTKTPNERLVRFHELVDDCLGWPRKESFYDRINCGGLFFSLRNCRRSANVRIAVWQGEEKGLQIKEGQLWQLLRDPVRGIEYVTVIVGLRPKELGGPPRRLRAYGDAVHEFSDWDWCLAPISN